MTLDKNTIQAIEAKAKLATEGPWTAGKEGVCECPLCGGEGEVDFADIDGDGWVALAQTYGVGPMIDDNKAFITSARTDIPALCHTALALMDEVERLKGALEASGQTGKYDLDWFVGLVLCKNADGAVAQHLH